MPLAIDEFPAFFVAAACAEGETLVTGAEELRVKESDRIAAMARGFEVLGIPHEVLPDGMRITGGQPVRRRHDRQPRRSPHRDGVRRGQPAGQGEDRNPGHCERRHAVSRVSTALANSVGCR